MPDSERSEPWVQSTVHDDKSADFTVTIHEDDHKFSATPVNGEAVVSYEETNSWLGKIRVSEPDESVFRTLMQSDEMTEYLERYGLDGPRRERHT